MSVMIRDLVQKRKQKKTDGMLSRKYGRLNRISKIIVIANLI